VRPPLVLIPQHFGCLLFDRRTSRYMPFDPEATTWLLRLANEPLEQVLAAAGPDREALERFFECYYVRGFFTLEGKLAAEVLTVNAPADHLVGPLAVHLEVVAACNLTCSHCFAGALPRRESPLTMTELDHLFRDMASLGSFRLGLTGGEPLLRKDLLEILDSATGHGLHPCLTTNGLLLTEELARELGRRDLVWLNVSLDGPDAATNDAIRGAGTFEKVLEKLELLRKFARFTLAFTIMRHNAHLVKDCATLAQRTGAHTAVFRPLYPAGTALHHLELMPTFSQYSGALQELSEMDAGSDMCALDVFGPKQRHDIQPQIHTNHACGAGQHVCSISVQGDVNPCSFLGPAWSGGNIRQTPFPVLWRESHSFRHMRATAPAQGGGCRARAQVFSGSADANDPWINEAAATADALHPGANVEVEGKRR
jgi:radical SAM protein with 4Fe4S-binding SPASM domain